MVSHFMVSQMAHAKNLGEPFMAHLENLNDIPCYQISSGARASLEKVIALLC